MYCLVQDNDSHWYVIPAGKKEEAWTYFDEIDRLWDDQDQWPERPSFLDEVGGSPSLVYFTDYVIL